MIHIVASKYTRAAEYAVRQNLSEYRVIISPTDLPKHPGPGVEVRFVGDYKKHPKIERILNTCQKRELRTKFEV